MAPTTASPSGCVKVILNPDRDRVLFQPSCGNTPRHFLSNTFVHLLETSSSPPYKVFASRERFKYRQIRCKRSPRESHYSCTLLKNFIRLVESCDITIEVQRAHGYCDIAHNARYGLDIRNASALLDRRIRGIPTASPKV